jgi:uncharacterized protein
MVIFVRNNPAVSFFYMNQLSISILPGEYSLCRLERGSEVPVTIYQSAFYSVSKSAAELSIIAETQCIPADSKCDHGWSLLKIEAVLNLSLTGITAAFSTALANAGVNLCVVATFDTDYILVKKEKLQVAKEALQGAGFRILP